MTEDDRAVLPRLVAARAESTPDRVFVEDVGGDAQTYAETLAAAHRWRDAALTYGVAREERVLTMLPTGIQAVNVWLGLAMAGAVETPINPAYRGQLLEYVIRDSGARLAIIHARYLADLAEGLAQSPDLHTLVVVGDDADTTPIGHLTPVPSEEFLAGARAGITAPVLERHQIGTMLYTSGTTGPSKGVLIPWAQLTATAEGEFPQADLGPDDAFYCPFPFFHVTAKASMVVMALCGGRMVFRERFDTGSFWDDVARHRCTTTVLLGAMAYFLYRQPERPDDAETPLRNIVMVPVIQEIEDFKRRFGVRIQALWNMTEASTCIASPDWDVSSIEACGKVRPGYEVRVADDLDRPVPLGEVGELLIRADEAWTMMAGYHGKPEATVEAWRNQWFHTGDLVRMDADGWVYFVDRKKDAIRRRGENISSQEVENAVYEHPDVQECAAIGVQSEWGEEEVKVVLTTRPGTTVDPAELIEFLRPRMARFMLPRFVEVVDALPKTPTEKVRKVELRRAGVTQGTWDRAAHEEPRRERPSAAPA